MASYPSWLAFLQAWRKSPRSVGALVETGVAASLALAEAARVGTADVVLELGAGTGSVTQQIAGLLPPGSELVMVERDTELAKMLRARFPGSHVVTGDALDSKRFLEERGIPKANSVVTAIPWTMLSPGQQDEMLNAISATMAPGAYMSAICYINGLALPSFWLFHRKLRKRFDSVMIEGPVWRNIPPAFIVSARKR